jgi:nitric-oxide synthase
VDHHTASEQFMIHYKSEVQARGGCPADWVWIVPPMSGSVCPVFHQEMAVYHLKPSYEYQTPAWKSLLSTSSEEGRISPKLRHFKEVARAVTFATELFTKALRKRIKATILYATETRKSEMFAKRLGESFRNAFNVQVPDQPIILDFIICKKQ